MQTEIVATYAAYLILSIGLTIWVARTLFQNGNVFLIDVFAGDEALAKSVNHLLVVGFYLVILGFVSLALKTNAPVEDTRQAIEVLAGKMGLVLLVLGGMHFLNLLVFARIRHTALAGRRPQPLGEAPGPGYTPFQ